MINIAESTMKHLFVLLLILFGSVPFFAHAAGQTYLLDEKDIVNFTVYAGEKQQLAIDLTVDSDGRLAVPMIGAIKAKGLTLAQLEQAIYTPLAADYFVNPQVMLTLKEFRRPSFFITGAVKNPGKYDTDQELTLIELIGKAGGLASEYGRMAYVTHNGSTTGKEADVKEEILEVDIAALLDSGGNKGNIRLKNGDKIHVPFKTEIDQAKTNIFIEGEVKNPGMYPYRPGLTALNACVMAGGFNEFSAPNRTKIIRANGQEKEVLKVDLERVKNGKAADVPLQPGDFIQVPETWL